MWYFLTVSSIFLILAGTANLSAKNLNLVILKNDTQVFERIVSEILKQNFSSPFALTQEPEGAYLPDYGVVVSFHLNINRSRIRTPFGEIPREEKRSKEEQMQILQDSMVRCLADYGGTFRELSDQDRVSISSHVEDRNELDPAERVSVMVITASKQDIDLLTSKQITFEVFRERVQITEY